MPGFQVAKRRFLRHVVANQDMKGSVDIRKILEDWPYDPENNARIVEGEGGRQVLQVRLPLGLEQYELEGRPDGVRLRGAESLLDHHLGRLEKASAAGGKEGFALSALECAELFEEGTLVYYRYLHLFALRDWARTVRDTDRNIRLFDFVNRYAAREEDRVYLEQWRPYILRINATARSFLCAAAGRHDEALEGVNAAIVRIERLPELEIETFQFERERSLSALRDLSLKIARSRPLSEIEKLERELKKAVAAQEFERAAVLRDRIKGIRSTSGGAGGAGPAP